MKELTEFENSTIPDPWSLPLETLDVSKAEIFQNNLHGDCLLYTSPSPRD